MLTGIYLLRFSDGSSYIGQSTDIQGRYRGHCNKLSKGTHVNSKMSVAYTKFGIPTLEILVECGKHELDVNEIAAIEIFDTINNGLNIAPGAGDFPILNGESNGFSKNKDSDIILIVEYLVANLDQPLKVSASILGIHYSTVKNIANGTSHRWLIDKIPEIYTKLISHKGKRIINTSKGKGLNYYINSPDNITFIIASISEFAKEHSLNAGALGEVLRGSASQHKGWKLPPN
jgi:GIY-YIG catalytic domain